MRAYFLGFFLIAFGAFSIFFMQQSTNLVQLSSHEFENEEAVLLPAPLGIDVTLLEEESNHLIDTRSPASEPRTRKAQAPLKWQSKGATRSQKKIGSKKYKVTRVEFTSQETRERAAQEELNPELVRAAYARQRSISSVDDQIIDASEAY